MARISIEVDLGNVIQKLQAMELRSTNFKPVFWEAQKKLEAANAANFSSFGGPVGGWAPRSQPAGWPLMHRTGNLRGSLTNLTGPPNNIGRTSAQFGTDVEYAKFHQSGTSKMPRRKVVFTPAGFARSVAKDAAEHIVGNW